MIHVDQGRPEHLCRLVRALLPDYPDIDVFTDIRAVLNVALGSVFILVPKPEDADWLNLNRPIFAQRQLKVVYSPVISRISKTFSWIFRREDWWGHVENNQALLAYWRSSRMQCRNMVTMPKFTRRFMYA